MLLGYLLLGRNRSRGLVLLLRGLLWSLLRRLSIGAIDVGWRADNPRLGRHNLHTQNDDDSAQREVSVKED